MESVRNLYLPQQVGWLIVYGPLTLCKKKIRKNFNIVPRASYLFDVGTAIPANIKKARTRLKKTNEPVVLRKV